MARWLPLSTNGVSLGMQWRPSQHKLRKVTYPWSRWIHSLLKTVVSLALYIISKRTGMWCWGPISPQRAKKFSLLSPC